MTLEKEAVEKAQQTVADTLFNQNGSSSYLGINTGRRSDDTDTVFFGYYLDGFYADHWIELHQRSGNEEVAAGFEKVWPKLTYGELRVRFALGTTDVIDFDYYELPDDPQFPELDFLRSELPEALAKWVIIQLPPSRISSLFRHLSRQKLQVSDIRDRHIREFVEGLEHLSLAQQKVAEELFEIEQQTLKTLYRFDMGFFNDAANSVFIGYYDLDFDIEPEIAFLLRVQGSLGAEHVTDSIAEKEAAWWKLDYARFYVRFHPDTQAVLASGIHVGHDYSAQQLDLFHSELPDNVAEWVTGLLEERNFNELRNRLTAQNRIFTDIKDERIRAVFQKAVETPVCNFDGIPLELLTDDNKCPNNIHSRGFGCPYCGQVYCPYCNVSVTTNYGPTLQSSGPYGFSYCEHAVICPVSFEVMFYNNLIDESTLLAAVEGSYKSIQSEGGIYLSFYQWEAAYKESLTSGSYDGDLSSLFKFRAGNEDEHAASWEEGDIPPNITETAQFYWEHSPQGINLGGFFCDNPEISQAYYQERAMEFIVGVNEVAGMEPDGTAAD